MSMMTRQRTWIAPGIFWALLAGIALGWWLRGGAPAPTVRAVADDPSSSALSTPLEEPPSIGSVGSVRDVSAANVRSEANGLNTADGLNTANGLNVTRGVDDRQAADIARGAMSGEASQTSLAVAPAARPNASTRSIIGADPVSELRQRHLRLPLTSVDVEALKGSFSEGRDRGKRPHEAVDIMAPRNTPIQAVEDGVIAKLFLSKAGGLTVYQFDPSQDYCYYYAHLEKYESGLKEGMKVRAGDRLGYVGSSGNASPNAPHLHFAIFRLTDAHHWWQGTPIDPYSVFSKRERG